MKKLLIAILLFVTGIAVYGQKVDFSTYERVVSRGKVTIVCQTDEYRLIVGSLKNPPTSLLIGTYPQAAVSSLNSLLRKGENEETLRRPLPTTLGGIRFIVTVSGSSNNRTFSLRGMDNPARFKLNAQDIRTMTQAILDRGN